MTNADLNQILDLHRKWSNSEDGGKRADLRGANLRGANLRNADLHGAGLCGADLRNANLRGANLRSADLRNANLRGANLCDANLRGVDLRGADLCDAGLCGADLDYSCWPLWSGSLDTKIDTRIATQLLYHLMRACTVSPDVSDTFRAALFTDALVSEANRFHRINGCERIRDLNGEG